MLFEQITRTATCSGTDTDRIPQSETIELCCLISVATIVDLISHKDDRQFGTAKDHRHILIPVCDSCLHIHQKEHQVCLFCGDPHLLTDGILKDII